MNRDAMLARALDRREPWDLIVVGGGATGVGVALDAVARGHDVLLLERGDFAGETSSASTKLIHGGVRYLRQGNLRLVRESVVERARLLRNAPGYVRTMAFLVPAYRWWEKTYYGAGLTVYDRLAGRRGIGRTRVLGRDDALDRIPTLQVEGLRGGVLYHDAQFEDARLAFAVAREAAARGAVVLNHCELRALRLDETTGRVEGAVAVDRETGKAFELRARVIVSATGAGTDAIRRMADPDARPMIRRSRGSHIVLDGSFLPGRTALMVPETPDGRLIFAIPWEGVTVVGTTDIPVDEGDAHPSRATTEEVDYLLALVSRYLARPPLRGDVRAVFGGIRPLVAEPGADETSKIARDHVVRVEDSGLVVVAGGKWTTYRVMAEDTVDAAERVGGLERRAPATAELPIRAGEDGVGERGTGEGDAGEVGGSSANGGARSGGARMGLRLADVGDGNDRALHERLPYTETDVIRAVRHEMARTLDDVLARRTRALYLDARAAEACAPDVVRILARELGRDEAWAERELNRFRDEVLPDFLPPR